MRRSDEGWRSASPSLSAVLGFERRRQPLGHESDQQVALLGAGLGGQEAVEVGVGLEPIDGPPDLIGRVVDVAITEARPNSLRGRLAEPLRSIA